MNTEKKILNDEELESVSGGALELLGFIVIRTHTEFKSSPDLNAETVGSTNVGSYRVYEIDTNQGLVWYRIPSNRWVAENPKIQFAMSPDFFD